MELTGGSRTPVQLPGAEGPRPGAGAEVIDYECIGGCGGPPVSAGRARAVVWDGEKYCMVRYVLTMPLGPYCVSCIGRELDHLNAAGAQRPAAEGLSPAARAMRRLRMERGLGYQEAGALLGIHPSTVCRAEHGKRTPPAAERIAAAFGVLLADIMTPCPQCRYDPPAGFMCLRCGTRGQGHALPLPAEHGSR